MNLNTQQFITLNQLIKHNNSFIFWPRQTGKSFLLSAYIEYFINNNYDQNIIYITLIIARKKCKIIWVLRQLL